MTLVCRKGDSQRRRVVLDDTAAVAIAGVDVLFLLGVQLRRRAEILNLLHAVAAFAFRFFSQFFCLFLWIVLGMQRLRRHCGKDEAENENSSPRDHFAPPMIFSIAVSSIGFNSILHT